MTFTCGLNRSMNPPHNKLSINEADGLMADVVEGPSSTTAPPDDAASAAGAPPAESAAPPAESPAPPESSATTEDAAEGAGSKSTPSASSEDQPVAEETSGEGSTAPTEEINTAAPETQGKLESSPDVTEDNEDTAGEGDEKPSSEKTTETSVSTEQTTTQAPTDPYHIEIPLEKKVNKRTKRKLWEEIEKRKPLIPKYVERHIQKYAKPPFELWGCKFRGRGSCYGCGG